MASVSAPAHSPSPAGYTSQQPVGRISFKATNNKAEPTPVRDNEHSPFQKSLEKVILENNCVRNVYNPSLGSGPAGWGREKEELKVPQLLTYSQSSVNPHRKPSGWGLVSAMFEAYNYHHKLVLRPDDIWQAILTQFSFYINAHAEALRDKFVDHEGKKKLVIKIDKVGPEIASRWVNQITENIKDPEVVDWLLPKFTTTQIDDCLSASVSVMSTFQAYFEYHGHAMCGIPEVTLEGFTEDWMVLRKKVDRLSMYDVDGTLKEWEGKLAAVLDQFVLSSQGKADIEFWDRIAFKTGGGSGPSYLNGWATVFCFFNHRGKAVGKQGRVPTGSIPVGVVSVPVFVDNIEHQMFAGQFMYEVEGDNKDTIRPRNDWAMTRGK